MSFLRNLPIARKFTFAFGAVCALCLCLGIFIFLNFRSIQEKSIDVRDNALPSIVELSNLRGNINEIRRQDLDLLLCQSAACTTQHSETRKQALLKYEETWKSYSTMISYPGERELSEKVQATVSAYVNLGDKGGGDAGRRKDQRCL